MGWDLETYETQPENFIRAIEHWKKKDFERQNKK